jgi:hypothetical protein
MEGVILIIDLIMGAEEVAEVVLHVVVVMLATNGFNTLVHVMALERHQPLVQLQSEFFCSYASVDVWYSWPLSRFVNRVWWVLVHVRL